MHFILHRFVPQQLWEKKNHHHLFNVSLKAHEEANTRIQVFYAVTPERINKSNKPRVDSLVIALERYHKTLQRHASSARESSVRSKIGDKDYRKILRYEEEVYDWLNNTRLLQAKLQTQIDAEKYFERQETKRKMKAIDAEKKQQEEYLKTKPLPPLRKSIVSYTTGLRSRVTVMPMEKDAEVWLMLEDEELNPIIEAYAGTSHQSDGFVRSPNNHERWI